MSGQRLGVVGLGLLGLAVSERLLGSGRSVIGFDVQPDRTTALEKLGGMASTNVAEIFASCDIVFLALPDSNIVRTLLDNHRNYLPGGAIIDLTTGDPDRMAEFGAELASRGVSYLDASVGGSSEQVRNGDAIVMAGGERSAVDRYENVIACFARQVFHMGPWGSGARMKLAMNLVLGLNRAVLAEGLAFADACGLSKQDALRVFRAGPSWSKVMETKGRRMIDHDFAPVARLSQHRKDVDLILAAAQKNGARTPLSALHRDLLAEVECSGFGDEDNAAVIRAFEKK